jgi:hypothetical protein
MNFAHIHTFIAYAVLGAGLIVVVSSLPPPSCSSITHTPHSLSSKARSYQTVVVKLSPERISREQVCTLKSAHLSPSCA